MHVGKDVSRHEMGQHRVTRLRVRSYQPVQIITIVAVEGKAAPGIPKRLAWDESAARRIRVVPVTITFADSTITAMNEQLATLIARDFAGDANRFCLSIGARRYARTAFGTNRPLSVAWNYVLIWHIFFTPFQKIADLWFCRVKFGQEISLLARGLARQGGSVASG